MSGGSPFDCAQGRRPRATGLPAVLALAGLLFGAGPVAAQVQEVVEYYATDALGSVRVVFNLNGQVVARADYQPFGELFAPVGELPPQQFTGQARDGEAGLDYFGARFYQPRHGRFTQVDPVYAGLFDPQQWNRYTYARANPLSFVDPDGRCSIYISSSSGAHYSAQCWERGNGGGGSVDWGLYSLAWWSMWGGGYRSWPGDSRGPYEPRPHPTAPGRPPETITETPSTPTTPTTTTTTPTTTTSTPEDGSGDGSGDDHDASNASASPARRFLSCTADHFGVAGLITRGSIAVASAPLRKEWLGLKNLGGASEYTNTLSYLGHRMFPDARLSFRVRGTTRLFGVMGRLMPYVGAAVLVYDAYSIGSCVGGAQ